MHTREKELQNLGLTDKESKVYLASLELGESAVQDIARKAGVNRATTYVMIEQLTAKGLMSSVERGKKRFFLAEAPDKLSTRVRLEITELEEKLSGFKRILPDLHSLYDTSGERPRVRFFEGEAGLLSVADEIHETLEDGLEVLQASSLDDYIRIFGSYSKNDKHLEKVFSKAIHTRLLFTSDKPLTPRTQQSHAATLEARRLPKDRFPFQGEMTIVKDKIFLYAYTGKLIAVVIESATLAQLVRAIYELAWTGSEKIHIEGGHHKPRNQ
ncbi:MAG: helix-turn-helix domain-containing protein [bacterium]